MLSDASTTVAVASMEGATCRMRPSSIRMSPWAKSPTARSMLMIVPPLISTRRLVRLRSRTDSALRPRAGAASIGLLAANVASVQACALWLQAGVHV